MANLTADLKWIRQQVERAQAEAAGRLKLGAITRWEQKEDYVNQFSEDFTGLVVHLTIDDPIAGDTFNGKKNMSQTEYDELKRQILGTLDSPPASAFA